MPPDTLLHLVRVAVESAARDTQTVIAHVSDTVQVRGALSDPRPWWESNLVAAVLGVLIGSAVTFASEVAREKRARSTKHRESLARLERTCTDYLNEIISNRRRAREAEAAARRGSLFWHFPHAFAVDQRFASEILDLDLNNRVMVCNLEMSRFNYDTERLRQAHDDLQRVLLAEQLPLNVWNQSAANEAVRWAELADHLDTVEELVRDISVRSILLVEQYDSAAARRRRLYGLGSQRTRPLEAGSVASARRDFDARRQALLDQNRREMEERRRRTQSEPPPGSSPPGATD